MELFVNLYINVSHGYGPSQLFTKKNGRMIVFVPEPLCIQNSLFYSYLGTQNQGQCQDQGQPRTQAVCRRNSLATYPGSNCIRIRRQKEYSCTHTSYEYWIMHVIFDRSHVTDRNVQARCCYQQDSLQAYIGWILSYLSPVDASLAVDLLLLTDVDLPV